ncbi:Panacea domain-containing protein [uncultured Sphingomonas sp.]|uniref:Panacea domain-containing protein n=1 Tax=uncultured Sphingomonas sp. TaxID=158754 RepID=UPI0025F5A09E|nr:Panacea domain-containing protein [uncultured Sphingomonas sp.]
MSFVPQIPEWFNTRRAAQVTAYLALKGGGRINILRATKLIYLADRLSMERRDAPITGDNLVSMKFGPVNSFTYSYMTGAAPVRQGDWAEFISPRRGHDLWLSQDVAPDDLDELSRGDMRILDETWDAYKDIGDQFDLAEWTHKFCPEWKDPNGSSIPIDYATVFKRLGKDDPIDLAEQVQADRQLTLSLSNS